MMTFSQIHGLFFQKALKHLDAKKYAFHKHIGYELTEKLNVPDDDSYGVIEGYFITVNAPDSKREVFIVDNLTKAVQRLGTLIDSSVVLLYIQIKSDWREYGEYLFSWDGV